MILCCVVICCAKSVNTWSLIHLVRLISCLFLFVLPSEFLKAEIGLWVSCHVCFCFVLCFCFFLLSRSLLSSQIIYYWSVSVPCDYFNHLCLSLKVLLLVKILGLLQLPKDEFMVTFPLKPHMFKLIHSLVQCVHLCARARAAGGLQQVCEDHMGAVCLHDSKCLCTIVKMLSYVIINDVSFLLLQLFILCGLLATTVFILKYKYDKPNTATVYFFQGKIYIYNFI